MVGGGGGLLGIFFLFLAPHMKKCVVGPAYKEWCLQITMKCIRVKHLTKEKKGIGTQCNLKKELVHDAI